MSIYHGIDILQVPDPACKDWGKSICPVMEAFEAKRRGLRMQERLQKAFNGVAVWQASGSINTRGESRSAEAEYRECTGRRTETGLGWSGGTSPQHRIKSSIHYKLGRYTRRSCAERCVFTSTLHKNTRGFCGTRYTSAHQPAIVPLHWNSRSVGSRSATNSSADPL